MGFSFSTGPRWFSRALVLSTVASLGLAACSLLTDLSPIAPRGDAAADAPVVAPDDGFTLVASPAHVVLDPGDAIDVTVSIVRGKQFTGLVDVTVNDVGGLSGLATTPATLTFTADTPVKLHVDAAKDAKIPQDGVVTLLGVARANTAKTGTTKFGVRLGSVLFDTTTSGPLVIPAYAAQVQIKAWGAGGAAGGSCQYNDPNTGPQTAWGAAGGAGGFASGWFAVSPGETLSVVVGTAAAAPTACPYWQACRGGGGGGFTTVQRGAAYVLVAGGGGGGGTGIVRGQNCEYGDQGQRGAAGGGGDGEVKQFGFGNPRPNVSATITTPGAAGGNQGAAGGPLLGGSGGNTIAGGAGAPGGGAGGQFACCQQTGGGGGGGGGGGWFGGGGGGQTNFSTYNGGGGGSGYLDGGVDAATGAGVANTPAAATDPDYKPGTAVGGVAAAAPIPAGPGRVLVRVAKP